MVLTSCTEQISIVFYLAHKLNKYAFYIDWHNHTVEDIDRLYRALNEVVCSMNVN